MKAIKLDSKERLTKNMVIVFWVFFIFVVSLFYFSNQAFAQPYKHPIFDSLKIIPSNPSPNDNVSLVCYTNLSLSPANLDSSKVSNQNNQIDVDLHYWIGNFMADFVRVDTIVLGYFNAGSYSLGAYAYSYMTGVQNFNSDTAYINFLVSRDDVGLKDENNLTSLKLYPNPAYDQLNFSLENNSNSLKLEVFDISGKKVKTKNFSNNSNESFNNFIDISDLKNGLYFCKFTSGNKQVTRRFVKE